MKPRARSRGLDGPGWEPRVAPGRRDKDSRREKQHKFHDDRDVDVRAKLRAVEGGLGVAREGTSDEGFTAQKAVIRVKAVMMEAVGERR